MIFANTQSVRTYFISVTQHILLLGAYLYILVVQWAHLREVVVERILVIIYSVNHLILSVLHLFLITPFLLINQPLYSFNLLCWFILRLLWNWLWTFSFYGRVFIQKSELLIPFNFIIVLCCFKFKELLKITLRILFEFPKEAIFWVKSLIVIGHATSLWWIQLLILLWGWINYTCQLSWRSRWNITWTKIHLYFQWRVKWCV